MDKRKRTIARQLFGLPSGRIHESKEERELVAVTLALSADPRMKRLSSDCLSPSHRGTSFAGLCDQAQIEYRDVERELKAISKSQGFIRISQHLPDLMEQSAVDARSRYEKCWPCKGEGVVDDVVAMAKAVKEATERGEDKDSVDRITKVCDACHGEKRRYVVGEVDRLKLVFETMGLIGKGGININNHLDLRQTGQSEGLEDLYGSVSNILEGEVKS